MNRAVLTGIVATLFAVGIGVPAHAQTYSNAVMALNPVGYWPLNESQQPPQILNITATNSGSLGAAANGYYGAWYQPSGNQWFLTNDIVMEPGPIAGQDEALDCQQTGGQYIILPRRTNGVANAAVTITAPFSLEAWVNLSTVSKGLLTLISEGGETTMNIGGPNPTNQFYGGSAAGWDGFSLGTYQNEFFFDCYETNGESKANELDSPANLQTGKWIYVVCTYDGSHEIIYTNGVQAGGIKTVNKNGAGLTYVVDPTSPLIIGAGPAEPVSYGNAFWGGMAEVAIYNQALSSSQVATHYQADSSLATYTNAVLADSPTIYFQMNDGQFPTNAGYPSANFPVATNYGTLGNLGNGVYQPGTTPGVAGPSYAGFGSNSKGVAINGWLGAVDVGSSNIPSALNPTGAVPMTVISWYQGAPSDSPGRFQEIVGHSDSSYRLALGQNTPVGENHFNPGPGPELQFATAAQVITNGYAFNDGSWHMVAGVSDGTNEYLYLDGTLALSNNNPAGIKIVGTTDDLLLGGDPEYTYPTWGSANTIRNFDGDIAQVSFWTNALTAAQIQSLFNAAGVPPSIWHQPVSSVTANQGQNVTISAGVRGSSPSYQWYFDGAAVAGQTNASLVLSPALASNSGTYYLVASGSSVAVTSSVVNVTIYGAPVITEQTSTNLQIFAGSSPTLYVTANGESPAYQWQLNGANISGATNSSYTLTNIETGATYGCVLTNAAGTNAIAPIVVTVLADPTAPYPAQVMANGPVAYYRLDEAPNATTAFDYVGGFNAGYTNVVTGNPGYTSGNAVQSDPGETSGVFGYDNPPNNYAGNVPPQLNFSTPNGSNAEFTVEAWVNETFYNGNGDCIVGLGYGGGEQFVLDTGATSAGDVRFFVRNAAGTVAAASSSVNINGDNLWHHIVGVCDEAGGHVYLYMDGKLLASSTITANSGILSSSMPLTIGARESGNSNPPNYDFQFYGYIDDVSIYNKALSASQVMADYNASGVQPLNIQVQPSSVTTNQGATVTFTSTAGGGTPPLTYQWFDENDNPIAGQTNTSLSLTNVQSSQSGTYTLTVANYYGTTNVQVSLTVNQGPAQITQDIQPTNVMTFHGYPVTLTVTAGGSFPLYYQWYQDGAGVAGATNSSFTFAALLGTNTYYCVISNSVSYTQGSGPVTSSTATVVGITNSTISPAAFNSHLKITFSGYNRGETLQFYPALVELGTNITGFSYGSFTSPSGADLRFADGSGTNELPYEINDWNPAGTSTIWVQVPALASNTVIWAYWGNPNDTTAPAYTTNGAVWLPPAFLGLPDYDVVYHLQQTNFPYLDSTLQYPALQGTAPGETNGIIGNAASFNGSSDYLDAGDVNLGNQFTESAWVDLAPTASNIQGLWCNGPGGYSTPEACLFVNDYNTADGALLFGVDNAQPETPTFLVTSNTWHLVTAAVNRATGTIQFYVDGSAEPLSGSGSSGVTTDFPTNNDMNLGRFVGGSFPFFGRMDEARIHGGIDDSNWVWADYMTVASNSVLSAYSAVTNTIPLPITLTIRVSGNQEILNWPVGTLQSAGTVNGPFSNVPGATPPYTNTINAAQQFYRVQAQY